MPRRATLLYRTLCLALTPNLVLATDGAPARIVPRRAMREFPLAAVEDARVLRFGGRFVSTAEGPIESEIRIYFNGVRLDGARLRGHPEATTPLMPLDYGVIYPRYHAGRGTFAFKNDADDIHNNGPWTDRYHRTRFAANHVGAFIQLELDGLPIPETNIIRVVNGHEWREFLVTTLEFASEPVDLETPLLPMPTYLVLRQSATERAHYTRLLETGNLPSVEAAELLAALGIADATTDPPRPEAAVARFRESLRTAEAFPSRAETLYRLVAFWQTAGACPIAEPDLRAAVAGAPGPWGALARTLLAARDGKPSPDRLLLDVPLVEGSHQVDGIGDDPFWQACPAIPVAHLMGTDDTVPDTTVVRIAATQAGLAVLFEGTADPSIKHSTGLEPDSPVWRDNCMELFVGRDLQFSRYYELNVSTLGGRYDGMHGWMSESGAAWNGDWQSSARFLDGRFAIEYQLPWSLFDLPGPPEKGDLLVANTMRILVDHDETGKRRTRILSAVPHEQVNTHRLMEGFVIRIN